MAFLPACKFVCYVEAEESQTRRCCHSPCNRSYRWFWSAMWMLGIKLGSVLIWLMLKEKLLLCKTITPLKWQLMCFLGTIEKCFLKHIEANTAGIQWARVYISLEAGFGNGSTIQMVLLWGQEKCKIEGITERGWLAPCGILRSPVQWLQDTCTKLWSWNFSFNRYFRTLEIARLWNIW